MARERFAASVTITGLNERQMTSLATYRRYMKTPGAVRLAGQTATFVMDIDEALATVYVFGKIASRNKDRRAWTSLAAVRRTLKGLLEHEQAAGMPARQPVREDIHR